MFASKKVKIINDVLAKLGLPKLEFGRRNENGKKLMIRRAAKDIRNTVLSQFSLNQEEKQKTLEILEDIKLKQEDSSRNDNIKVAALFSGSLTIREISEHFGISIRASQIAS